MVMTLNHILVVKIKEDPENLGNAHTILKNIPRVLLLAYVFVSCKSDTIPIISSFSFASTTLTFYLKYISHVTHITKSISVKAVP